MSENPKPKTSEIIFGSPLSVAGVIGLIADSLGLILLVAGVTVSGRTDQLWAWLAILGALLLAAVGLLLLGARNAKIDSARVILQFCAYTYAVLAAMTYASIAFILTAGNYTAEVYRGSWAIIAVELVAFGIIRWISKPTDRGWFAVPLFLAIVWHGALLVVVFLVLRTVTSPQRLQENLVFMVVMLIVAAVVFLVAELPDRLRRNAVQRTKLRPDR